jgi:N utilization substance protein B
VTRRDDGARRRAREVAFRVIYQAELLGEGFGAAWLARQGEERLSSDQTELVEDVMRALANRLDDVDATLREGAPNWSLERLAATDRSVLRAAVAELISRPGTPARVVLDEAIELAKRYGTEESGRFVNGVLDHVARALRPAEFA